ncbi:MAG: hypothetical protein EPN61_08910 [Burkholderiaceae bacterium]|nr:MAG: hypothetical protein EPN61_08910 [Burkholderiaceae bacterium]
MLKEVGASGQISLGKKYAGQLFNLQTAADGSVTLTPVKVTPVAPEQAAQTTKAWADAHVADIEQYNAWSNQNGPYSQRVRRWRLIHGAF